MMDFKTAYYHNNTIYSKAVTDKTYLIVTIPKSDLPRAGLGWFILLMLSGIRAAIENGYIPVIDWQSYPLPFYKPESVGKVNIWELYFEQPCNICLEQAYQSGSYYIVDSIQTLLGYKHVAYLDLQNLEQGEGRIWLQYFQQYIRLKKTVKNDYDEQFGVLFEKMHPVVGVLYRGTDYKMLKPPGHGAIPKIDIVIDEVQKIIKEKNAETVFLVTEDKDVLHCFKMKFAEKLKYIESERYTQTKKTILNLRDDLEADKYNTDYNYLMALYFLSLTESVVYTPCSGSIVSALWGRDRDYYNFLYKGNYYPLGIIIGSDYEEDKERLVNIFDKPLIYYSLNMMIYLGIRSVLIACSIKMKPRYQLLLGDGEAWGMNISYVERTVHEDIGITLHKNINRILKKRLCIMSENQIFFGGNFTQKVAQACQAFDGSYAFCCIQDESQQKKLEELYFFDLSIDEIIRKAYLNVNKVNLRDIQTEYEKEKLFIVEEFNRGTVRINVNSDSDINDATELIRIIQKHGGWQVGNPYLTALQKGWIKKELNTEEY